MKSQELPVFVSQIGINRIFLSGTSLDDYSRLENAETIITKVPIGKKERIIKTVILNFADSKQTIEFLEKIVKRQIPFSDNYKSNAYMEACALLKDRNLENKIIGC